MAGPHRLVITRPGEGGVQDREAGEWMPAPPTPLYDGPADVQDSGVVISRAEDGTPALTSDAAAYPDDWSQVGRIRPGDNVRVHWEDEDASESTGEVLRVRRLDGVVFLRWLT
jgi:hypothetical protein